MRRLIVLVLCVVLGGAADAQVGGNLARFPPVDHRIDITNGSDGKLVLKPVELKVAFATIHVE